MAKIGDKTTQYRCFLCSVILDDANSSFEHVFDDALLRHFELRNATLNLPNRTTIRYNQLLIPCCANCNNHRLRPVWERVLPAIQSGPDALRKLDADDLYVWLAKVYYGLHVRDSVLSWDRTDPKSDKIATKDLLRSNMFLKFFANLLLDNPGKVHAKYSLFIFDCEEPPAKNERFWFNDSQQQAYVSIKLDKAYIVAFLHDLGMVSELEMSFPLTDDDREDLRNGQVRPFLLPKLARKLKLNILQVRELGALYQALAVHIFPMEVKIYPDRKHVLCQYVGKPVYDGAPPIKPWSHDTYMQCKRLAFGEKFLKEALHASDAEDFSFIYNPDIYDYSTM